MRQTSVLLMCVGTLQAFELAQGWIISADLPDNYNVCRSPHRMATPEKLMI